MNGKLRDHAQMRFVAPVILENIVTMLVGMVFSSIIGGISASALAGVALVNSVVTVIIAVLQFLVVGASVLTARLIGEGNAEETSRTVEQSLLLSLVLGVGVTVLLELLANPLMGLLLPTAEPGVFEECMSYYRMLMLSFPFFLLFNVLGGVLRAAGDSRASLYGALLHNVAQVAAAWVLIAKLNMNVAGAGLAFVICRVLGAGLLLLACLRSHVYFQVRPANVFRPDWQIITRIARVGAPVSLDAFARELGYLAANSLVIGLGTADAAAYQIVCTLIAFSCFPQTVGNVATTTLVGQMLGAQRFEEARKRRWNILMVTEISALVLSVLLAVLGKPMAGLYTTDIAVRDNAAACLWVMILYSVVAIGVNVNEGALRVAGDTKYVMILSILAAWAVRLPMMYLLCFVFDFGALGALIANISGLTLRTVMSEIRLRKDAWLYRKLDG